jgi:SAM-dependent methyltransferase
MNGKHIRTSDCSHIKRVVVNNFTVPASAEEVMRQYSTEQKAKEYALSFVGTARHRREKECIVKALATVPRGAHVLDLPCGCGRHLPLLKKLGYRITAADSSVYMLTEACYYTGPHGENCIDKMDNFHIVNIFETPFPNNHFNAIVCNRLFHHFNEPEIRQQALVELRRICSGPIIVSFFCNFSIDALTSELSDMVRGRHPSDRIPVSFKNFEKEASECGLIVEKWIPARPFISKQWYAILKRDNNAHIHSARLYDIVDWTKMKSRISRVASIAAVIFLGGFLLLNMRAVVDPHEFEVERIAREYQDGNDEFYVSADDDLEDLRTNDKLSVIENIDLVEDKIADDQSHLKDSYFLVSEKDAAKLKNMPVWARLSFIKMVNLKNEHFILLSTETVKESIGV